MSYIYLASPYTHPSDAVKAMRYEKILNYVSAKTLEGEIIFSPIVHSHPMHVTHGVDGDWDFWSKIDKVFIDNCAKVRVVCMEGWNKSKGIAAEVEYAKQIGKEVEYYEAI